MGKSSINGPFSMAMLNSQMVYIYIYIDKMILGMPIESNRYSIIVIVYIYIHNHIIYIYIHPVH